MRRVILAVMILSLAMMGCATPPGPATPTGALIGGTVGGITGAVVGNQLGSSLAGAAIGAGVGMLTGAAIGNAQDAAVAAQRQPTVVYEQRTYAAPSVQQEAVQPPPGRWVNVPGQWVGGNWVPAHKVWVPVNP